jgi:hypothetical protein
MVDYHSDGKTVKMPTQQCLYCLARIDSSSPKPGNDAPTPGDGDVTVCFLCGGLMVFTNELKLRLPTPQEFVLLIADEDVMKFRQDIIDFNHAHPRTRFSDYS